MLEPHYLASPDGALYVLHLPPMGRARGVFLWLPPLAEEAHCARRHVMLAAREAQQKGFASVVLDLFGTGESEGEFVQANWSIWLRNVQTAAEFARSLYKLPLYLTGLRASCLLAADAVTDVEPTGVLCWQPVTSGRAALDNLLRIRLAAHWAQLDEQEAETGLHSAGEILAALRSELAAGRPVEVAGYMLSPSLADDLASRTLSWAPEACAGVICLEFRTRAVTSSVNKPGGLGHTPALIRQLEIWRGMGLQVASGIAITPQFWLAHEAPLSKGLGDKSVELIERFTR